MMAEARSQDSPNQSHHPTRSGIDWLCGGEKRPGPDGDRSLPSAPSPIPASRWRYRSPPSAMPPPHHQKSRLRSVWTASRTRFGSGVAATMSKRGWSGRRASGICLAIRGVRSDLGLHHHALRTGQPVKTLGGSFGNDHCSQQIGLAGCALESRHHQIDVVAKGASVRPWLSRAATPPWDRARPPGRPDRNGSGQRPGRFQRWPGLPGTAPARLP